MPSILPVAGHTAGWLRDRVLFPLDPVERGLVELLAHSFSTVEDLPTREGRDAEANPRVRSTPREASFE